MGTTEPGSAYLIRSSQLKLGNLAFNAKRLANEYQPLYDVRAIWACHLEVLVVCKLCLYYYETMTSEF